MFGSWFWKALGNVLAVIILYLFLSLFLTKERRQEPSQEHGIVSQAPCDARGIAFSPAGEFLYLCRDGSVRK
jgi:hypothetical protein